MPPPHPLPLTFSARVVKGAGRGRRIGSPTLNLRLEDVPSILPEGIFACRAHWGSRDASAALHYGPRPVFKAGIACELHLIDRALTRPPKTITVEVLQFLRPIRNFRTVELLKKQIARDIVCTKKMIKRA